MSQKQELIQKMLKMQHKFSAYEQENGVNPEEFYAAPEGHPLHGYREEYNRLALELLELAHAEAGSHR
ncbi:MAG: hypothetical protein B7Z66_10785 [Chromatiales bacterium 21-64-14]|nr:MAG: hypothetical protein B7Z66_10785 [Chromatiales bacterium 21-64-14]HQU15629.1 hypothetical protein [Gammaproteobacteria bacterium]